MQRMRGLLVGSLGVLAVCSLAACSTGRKAYIPVDSALRTWQPPDPDAYAPAPPAAAPAATAPAATGKKK